MPPSSTGCRPAKAYEHQQRAINAFMKSGYEVGRTIGEGACGKVKTAYKTFANGYRQKIAVKIINTRKALKEIGLKFIIREINTIRFIQHPHIVTTLDVVHGDESIFIFMELCKQGDLFNYITKNGPLPECDAKHYFRYVMSTF